MGDDRHLRGIRLRADLAPGMSEGMPGFSPPTSRVRLSFIAAMEEFRAEGRGSAMDDTMLGREIRDFGLDWQDPGRFDAYTSYLRDQARADAPRRPGYVPSTTLWWVDGDEYLGRLAIRHRLTPRLTNLGGHIGYDVKPSARRQGHATAMLAAALPLARARGIDPALVTCDESNAGSRRVIEANGGVLEDKRGSELRFWVPTS
jgi:predicted acetyltransferase